MRAAAERVDWRIVPASVTGPGHLDSGTGNQDAFGYAQTRDGFAVAVADGAGSAGRAATGARLAVDSALAAARPILCAAPRERAIRPAVARRYADAVLTRFDAAVAAVTGTAGAGTARPDYATTLLSVIARPPRYLYLSVGDSFLVVEHAASSAHLVVAPDGGGDRGASVFLTSRDRLADLDVGVIEDPWVSGLALCTDGLLEAVLDADQWPDGSQRLFAPPDFAMYLRMFSAGDARAADLADRLRSPEFAACSADDKTMVLAVRR